MPSLARPGDPRASSRRTIGAHTTYKLCDVRCLIPCATALGAFELDPQRAREAADFAVRGEDGGPRGAFAAVPFQRPADDRAGLPDVHQAIDAHGDLTEEHQAILRARREIARAVERRRHELRPHLAVAPVERGIGNPGRGHETALRDRAGEDSHAIPSLTLGTAYEASGKAMIGESGIPA